MIEHSFSALSVQIIERNPIILANIKSMVMDRKLQFIYIEYVGKTNAVVWGLIFNILWKSIRNSDKTRP